MFVFLDPPYYKVTKGLYGKYGDWEKKDFRLLKRRLKRTPHKFLLTVNDDPFVKSFFLEEGFTYIKEGILILLVPQEKKDELIITNYEVPEKLE